MNKVVQTRTRVSDVCYADIIDETTKKSKNRGQITDNKGKKIKPRRYHLLDSALSNLKAKQKKTGKFPNPFRKNGVYYNLVQALINLGENKSHRFIDVKNEMKRIMEKETKKNGENVWENFINKKSDGKSDLSRWDANTRIERTAGSLQRLGGLHPYGWKLRQLNACIDLLPSSDPLLPNKPNIRLNTTFSCPEDVQPLKPAHAKKGS